jgi:hypothetical protein
MYVCKLTADMTQDLVRECCLSRGCIKCILPERTALHGEILRAWRHVLNPSTHPIHIFLQIEHRHHTEEINIDLQLQNCTTLLITALNIAA